MSDGNEAWGEDRPSADRILDIASGYEPALILEAAVRLRVFDALDARPMTLGELVDCLGASERGLRAILNALVTIGLLDKQGDQYLLTPESDLYLVSGKPAFQGHMCKHVSRHLLPRWTKLTEVVRSGRPTGVVNEQADGGAYFQEFVEDIFPMSYDAARALASHLRVANSTEPISVLDLAAGSGVWGVALAEASRQVRVVAVDWPAVIPVTQRVARKHNVFDQFQFVEGDLISANFGCGYAIATLGHIIHSEGEARSRALLKKTFDALKPGGTVVIAEFVANEERSGPPSAMIFAVTMLVNTDVGDTYTFSEMASWLRDAGFVNARTLDVPEPTPLILATKPG